MLHLLVGYGKVCAEFWRRWHRGLHFGIIHQEHHHGEVKHDRIGPRSDPTKGLWHKSMLVANWL